MDTWSRKQIPLDQVLVKGSRYQSNKLKKRLVKAGILEDACALCDQPPWWNDLPLVLQLDHIDGDRTNNRLDNLRIVCPNCHTQTSTWGHKVRDMVAIV